MKKEIKGLMAATVATLLTFGLYWFFGAITALALTNAYYVFYWYDKFNK